MIKSVFMPMHFPNCVFSPKIALFQPLLRFNRYVKKIALPESCPAAIHRSNEVRVLNRDPDGLGPVMQAPFVARAGQRENNDKHRVRRFGQGLVRV